MDLDKNTYTLVRNALTLNKASIIKEDDNYLFVDDKEAAIFYIVVKKTNESLPSIIDNAVKYEPTVSVISETKLNLASSKTFKCFRETYQYSYTGKPFVIEASFDISHLTIEDYDYLKTTTIEMETMRFIF